jgi:biotin synthase
MNMRERIDELASKVVVGNLIDISEAHCLAQIEDKDLPFLLAAANLIRQHYQGDDVHLCSILNARSGRCSEDCSYCAQSIYHQTGVDTYPLLDADEVLKHAEASEKAGVSHFSIVISGKGMEGANEVAAFDKIIEIFTLIKEKTRLQLCASLGSLTLEQAERLRQVGVTRYHHNVETSSDYYPTICRTHTYEDRIQTVRIAKQAGLSVCSGGIIGMGESMLQRITMAFELRAMNIKCVPVNILNPVPGTRMEAAKPMPPLEILRTIAIFRFIMPQAIIRTAGGREKKLRDLQSMALFGGANGMLVGGYLTTAGRDSQLDIKLIEDLGLRVAG